MFYIRFYVCSRVIFVTANVLAMTLSQSFIPG